ncbi:hypothetical protein D3C72_1406180 [compost metagenome]
MSFLGRLHRALALFTVSHSPVFTMSPGWSFSPSFHSSFSIRMGREMWSEYLAMTCLSFQALRYSSASSRRCRTMLVPRCGRLMVSTSKSPVPPLIQRTPSSAGRPARRDSTVILSATMKPE